MEVSFMTTPAEKKTILSQFDKGVCGGYVNSEKQRSFTYVINL
ncbi:hypothetical protein [Enterobacter hormaechei]|nr:hypothetical protein [Enterobacter hormaechei]